MYEHSLQLGVSEQKRGGGRPAKRQKNGASTYGNHEEEGRCFLRAP